MNKINIFKDEGIDLKTTISILLMVMVLSSIFGFIYEELFYRIDLGYFVKRGTTYGPWIPIYFFGGLLITIFTYRFKDKPIVVFLLNTIITGLLEYITGYALYEYAGIRLWDYNKEIWNFGNINGYVCLRSVLFFGVSSLFLIYVLIPILIRLFKNSKTDTLHYITYAMSLLFIADMIVYRIIN